MWKILRFFDGKRWKTGKYLSADTYEANWRRFLENDCQQFPDSVGLVGYRLDSGQWVEDRRHDPAGDADA